MYDISPSHAKTHENETTSSQLSRGVPVPTADVDGYTKRKKKFFNETTMGVDGAMMMSTSITPEKTHPFEVKPLRLRHRLRLRRPALLRQGRRRQGARTRPADTGDGGLEVPDLQHLPQPLPDDCKAVVAPEAL